jgi:hypothetical protein
MDGCATLANVYINGLGADKDMGKAIELLEKSCDADSMQGCGALGYILSEGKGVDPDIDRGKKLLDKACKGGNQWACIQAAKLENSSMIKDWPTQPGSHLFA